MWAREWGLEPAGKSGLESARGVVVLEYRVSVKVSWEFAKLLECPGHKAFSKAGIQGFYSGASKNFTGVILDIWGIAAVILDSSPTRPRRHSATAFGNTPQFLPVISVRGGKPSRSTKF